LEDFEVVNPVKMRDREIDMASYGEQEIMNLANRFNIDPDASICQWKKVLRHLITEEPSYCPKKIFENGKNPSLFWSYYLNKDIGLGEDILKLLKIVLVLPSNSADAEKSFSILDYF